MGSLETASPPTKRSPPPPPGRHFIRRSRSRVARYVFFEKVDYCQCICSVGGFFLLLVLFQAYLSGSGAFERPEARSRAGDLAFLREIGGGGMEFGEGIRFYDSSKLRERFEREGNESSSAAAAMTRPVGRIGARKPQLAMVVPDLSPDALQLQVVSTAIVLREMGYDIQIYSLEDGLAGGIWRSVGVHVTILSINMNFGTTVDWLSYNGVLVYSLGSRHVISCLMQEPFKSVPVIWTVHEKSLAVHLSQYARNGQIHLISDWKQAFSRASVIVFPAVVFPVMYAALDDGNFFVIPGSPEKECVEKSSHSSFNVNSLRVKMGYNLDDFVIAVVGSQILYSGMWLEHAFVLQALAPLIQEFTFNNTSWLKVGILTANENTSSANRMAFQTIALKFGYPSGSMELIVADENKSNFLGLADLVIYASFLEEESFPAVLMQAMCLEKLIIAPDLSNIKKYVVDEINGYLFPKVHVGMLTQIVSQIILNGKLSPFALKVASEGKMHARNLMVTESMEGYSYLLENVLKLSSEVLYAKHVVDVPPNLTKEWQWHLFENKLDINIWSLDRGNGIFSKLEEQLNQTHSSSNNTKFGEAFTSIDWEGEKAIELANARKKLEEEELKDRIDQPHGTWEDAYRSVKRAERAKNELRERDDRELERTGQVLCIYEPYFGEGTWPFLHDSSLYRGIGLSSKGRRPGADDIDASSRIPLLADAYYRDILGEYGAFFALANRIDRIHKNAWIGFQAWRLVPRKRSLSRKGEAALLEAIQEQKHGDALYFWVRVDKDPRNPHQLDFWSFCDSINAGNCRFAVSEALRRMYGLTHELESLPPMPNDGNTWSVMHSWALPTRSFLEFVLFSRMFVDAMDSMMYDEHHRSERCYLSLFKDRHCYSRVLELLVNVWAYHSARLMVYLDPETGSMQEQHKLNGRSGQMWIKWFSFPTLKAMDEDLAEAADTDLPGRRWLWPSTGEVYWQGVHERERSMRQHQKERRKQQSRDKIQRIKKRARQKSLGKYVRPPPEDTVDGGGGGGGGDPNDTRIDAL